MRSIVRPKAYLLCLAIAAASCRPQQSVRVTSTGPDAIVKDLGQLTGAPMVRGNAVEPIENGAVFDAMETDIRSARHSIHVVTFIWRGEEGPAVRLTRAILARREGVACRIVIDPFGSLKFSDAQEEQLEKSGCEIHSYGLRGDLRPTARNHRKILVVDGRVAITGGWGIWKVWEGDGLKEDEWRDSSVRVRGPVVEQMQRAFEQSWKEAGGKDLPRDIYPALKAAGDTRAAFVASSPREGPSQAELMTKLLLSAARKRLWIANSYFVPDDEIIEVLVAKAKAGVDVRVLAPGPVHDVAPVRAGQRATYHTLLDGGVRIWEYQPSMMHAKTMVIDDHIAVVGSTNLDQLSFDRLEEGSLVAESRALVNHLEKHIAEDLRHSKEITKAEWDKRDKLTDIAREAASFFSDWL